MNEKLRRIQYRKKSYYPPYSSVRRIWNISCMYFEISQVSRHKKGHTVSFIFTAKISSDSCYRVEKRLQRYGFCIIWKGFLVLFLSVGGAIVCVRRVAQGWVVMSWGVVFHRALIYNKVYVSSLCVDLGQKGIHLNKIREFFPWKFWWFGWKCVPLHPLLRFTLTEHNGKSSLKVLHRQKK